MYNLNSFGSDAITFLRWSEFWATANMGTSSPNNLLAPSETVSDVSFLMVSSIKIGLITENSYKLDVKDIYKIGKTISESFLTMVTMNLVSLVNISLKWGSLGYLERYLSDVVKIEDRIFRHWSCSFFMVSLNLRDPTSKVIVCLSTSNVNYSSSVIFGRTTWVISSRFSTFWAISIMDWVRFSWMFAWVSL